MCMSFVFLMCLFFCSFQMDGFRCALCRALFRERSKGRRHQRRAHGPVLECCLCDYVVRAGEQERLDRHTQRAHTTFEVAVRTLGASATDPLGLESETGSEPQVGHLLPREEGESAEAADEPAVCDTQGKEPSMTAHPWKPCALELPRSNMCREDPRTWFVGAPSDELSSEVARRLSKFRTAARKSSNKSVEVLPQGVAGILQKEVAILPDGTKYELTRSVLPEPQERVCRDSETQCAMDCDIGSG